MRVLFVLSNLRGGGAERAVINLASGLSGRGHESHIILLEQISDYSVPATVKLHALTGPDERMSSGWIGKRLLSWRLRRLHDTLAPFDLVVSTLPLADEVVRRARLPNVHYRIANNLSAEIAALEDSSKAVRRVRRYRRLYDGQKLIAVSEGVAADLRDGLGLTGADITTIYNPFDFEQVRSLSRVPEPDLPKVPYVVHVGRFQRQKRHDLLFEAFRKAALPHRLVLLTSNSSALRAMIASFELEERVTVAGFRENPFPWYANASALVLSSDREGLPNVLIEGLICGTTVVSTDCPSGPSEILQGELSRWLVPRGDAAALAARMCEAVQTKLPASHSALDRFSKDSILDAFERIARAASVDDRRVSVPEESARA